MKNSLAVGAAEVDITPEVGTGMVGALVPRYSKGIQDPLYAKAMVIESEGVRRLVDAGQDLLGELWGNKRI